MKAVQIDRHGGPEVMMIRDLPDPTPGPGQILIRQVAVGVNFLDVYHRIGLYKMTLPLIVGQEGAGTVEAVGSDVRSPHVGDRVTYANVPGGYAELVAIAADRAVIVPSKVSS